MLAGTAGLSMELTVPIACQERLQLAQSSHQSLARVSQT